MWKDSDPNKADETTKDEDSKQEAEPGWWGMTYDKKSELHLKSPEHSSETEDASEDRRSDKPNIGAIEELE